MNLLAEAIVVSGLIHGLIYLVIALLVIGAVYWTAVSFVPLPPPMNKIVQVVFGVIVVIVLLVFLLSLVGCATNSLTGKKEFDPEIRNALIDVARGAVAGLETSAATTGTVNWQAAAQGALSQAYSAESVSAMNKAISESGLPKQYQPAVTTAANTIVAVAQDKGLSAKDGVAIGLTALDNALQASKAP